MGGLQTGPGGYMVGGAGSGPGPMGGSQAQPYAGGGEIFDPVDMTSLAGYGDPGFPGGVPGVPGGSSNQFSGGPLPPSSFYNPPNITPPGAVPPGAVPQAPRGTVGNQTGIQSQMNPAGNFQVENPLIPGLTQAFGSYLGGQIGQGITPFNLATPLSTGGSTLPGQVNAPMNPLLQQLMQFYQTGQGGGPGAQTLNQEAQTGDPFNVSPEWQAMVAAQQRNIQQNAANLKEQFNFEGDLASSPMGNAMGDYYNQANLQQNALLGQLTQSSYESAQGRMMGASQYLQGAQTQLGQIFQGMNQQDIQNLLSEFMTTQPQFNPLLQMIYGESNTFAPFASNKFGVGGTAAALSAAGSLASGAASVYSAIDNSGGGTDSGGGSVPSGTTGTDTQPGLGS